MTEMKMSRLNILLLICLLVLIAVGKPAAKTSIKYTKHNLSNWGQYDVKASGTSLRDTEVCIFCHSPHNADSSQAPLWNRADTSQTFRMASTVNVVPGSPGSGGTKRGWADSQPTGISKKCLSCHDGSLAIGQLYSGISITMTGQNNKLDIDQSLTNNTSLNPFGANNLSGGHVISFKYYSAVNAFGGSSRFNVPIASADAKTMLDRQGRMQCHTCHDPHGDSCNDSSKTIGNDPLWRKACDGNGNGSVCNVCHKLFAEYTAPNLKY